MVCISDVHLGNLLTGKLLVACYEVIRLFMIKVKQNVRKEGQRLLLHCNCTQETDNNYLFLVIFGYSN